MPGPLQNENVGLQPKVERSCPPRIRPRLHPVANRHRHALHTWARGGLEFHTELPAENSVALPALGGTLGEDGHHPALIRLQEHTPDLDPPHARVQDPSEGGAGWFNMGLPDATQSSPLAEGGSSHRAGSGRCQGQGTDGGETITGAGARWVPRVNQGSKPRTCSTVLLDFT